MTRKLRLATLILCGAVPLAGMAVDYGGTTGTSPQQESGAATQPAPAGTGSTGSMGSPGSSHEGGTTERGGATTEGSATNAMPPENVSAKFKDLDKNRDGQLSRSEAKVSPELKAHFKEIDADRNGKVSLSEWQSGQDKLGAPAGVAGSKGSEKARSEGMTPGGTGSGGSTGSGGNM